MKRQEWLEERKKSIGGSDAAAVIGLNPYVTPYMLWTDKTNRLPEKEDSEAMRQGRDLEEYVAKRFCEITGKKVRRKNQIIKNEKYLFAHANIDREIVGEKAGLECKTTSALNMKKFKNGEYPDQYYVQCVHYMAVTGYKKWYLAVLIFGQDFKVFEIERDESEIESLMAAEKDFWENYVMKDIPPKVDGLSPTTKAINTIFPGGEEGAVQIINESAILQYYALTKQIKELTAQRELFEQQIKEELGDTEEGTYQNYVVNWKSQSRTTFDYKKFSEKYPRELLEPFFKTTNFRKFTVKELKNNG